MSEKIKVLWVANALGCGGAERQMLYMYDILNKYCDLDITILYYAKVGDALNIEGVKTVFIDKSKVGKLATVRGISKCIKENDIQIMHAFGGSSANMYGRFGAMFTKAVPVGAVLGKKHFVRKSIAAVNSFLNLFGNWWTVNNTDLVPILKRDLAFLPLDGRPLSQTNKLEELYRIRKPMYEAFADHAVSNNNDPDGTVRQILRDWEENR